MGSWAEVMAKGINIYMKKTQTTASTYNLKISSGFWGDWYYGSNKDRELLLGG